MSLKNRKVVVTGGPTREWIDPVRYISNASSGKMGIALADAAGPRCAETVFVHGPIERSLLEGRPYRTVAVETTGELLDAVMREIDGSAVLIMAAAPADYRPASKSPVKIKKDDEHLTIDLVKNPDILMAVVARRAAEPEMEGLYTAGFAAETHDAEAFAREKLAYKNLDMICLNDVGKPGAGFSVDTNIMTVFTRRGARVELALASKRDIAVRILDLIESDMGARKL
ncbi:MAG: phosphopantothenoylcysteine decarboxylase [Spirochaetes bacterium]|nr:MAG: phosphopantothenoylcysteine decarboxylase [Spirochaetota bacterium]